MLTHRELEYYISLLQTHFEIGNCIIQTFLPESEHVLWQSIFTIFLQKLAFHLGPLTHHSLPHVLSLLLLFQRHRLTIHIPASWGTGRRG